MPSSEISEALREVQTLVEADAQGDAVAHRQLLEAVHRLQLKAESPFDTAMRQKFQVLRFVVGLGGDLVLIGVAVFTKHCHTHMQ
jgi:hypothetical protein